MTVAMGKRYYILKQEMVNDAGMSSKVEYMVCKGEQVSPEVVYRSMDFDAAWKEMKRLNTPPSAEELTREVERLRKLSYALLKEIEETRSLSGLGAMRSQRQQEIVDNAYHYLNKEGLRPITGK